MLGKELSCCCLLVSSTLLLVILYTTYTALKRRDLLIPYSPDHFSSYIQ
jgi:hypothetical protein